MNPYPLGAIQIMSIVGSAGLISLLVLLIRKKKLRVEYAVLWIAISILFLIISVFRGLIDLLSNLLGISYQPAALFLVLFVALFLLMLHFSIVISDLKDKINTLVTNLTMLDEKMRRTDDSE